MPKPRPSSTRRPSAISRHSSVSYKYSPDSCEVTPLIRLSSTSDAEVRQAYRKGKIVGVLLALGFLVCVGLFLLSIDVWVWRKRREDGNGLGEGGRGGGGAGGMSGLLGVGSGEFVVRWLESPLFRRSSLFHFVYGIRGVSYQSISIQERQGPSKEKRVPRYPLRYPLTHLFAHLPRSLPQSPKQPQETRKTKQVTRLNLSISQ